VDPVDDELDLLPGEPGPTPPRRPKGLLIGVLVVIAVLAVGGVFWMVSEVAGRGGTIGAAGTPAPTRTYAPETTPPPETIPASRPTATFSVPAVPSTVPVAVPTTAAPRTSAPPPPKATPTVRPKPTLATPVGKLVRVPNVVGLRIAQATAQVKAAGLRPQVLGGVLDVDRDQRRVTATRPTGGSLVRTGSTVILVSDGV
jgi:PASTA domain